jgi:hypothetical protein
MLTLEWAECLFWKSNAWWRLWREVFLVESDVRSESSWSVSGLPALGGQNQKSGARQQTVLHSRNATAWPLGVTLISHSWVWVLLWLCNVLFYKLDRGHRLTCAGSSVWDHSLFLHKTDFRFRGAQKGLGDTSSLKWASQLYCNPTVVLRGPQLPQYSSVSPVCRSSPKSKD